MNDQSLIPSKTPVTDPRTGLVDRLWQRYLLWLQSAAVGTTGQCLLTLTGVAPSVQGLFDYKIIGGDLCILTPPVAGLSGVSNSVTCTITGLPAFLSPSIDALGFTHLNNNTTGALGNWYLAAGSSVIRLDIGVVSGIFLNNSANSFTAAGTKGVGPWVHFIYRLQRPT